MPKLWDISPPVAPGSPVFPGDTPFGLRWAARIGPGCPVNLSGGLIGCGHPVGATGARMLHDAARQVTDNAGECQIDGCHLLLPALY